MNMESSWARSSGLRSSSGAEWTQELVLTDVGTLTGDLRATGTSDTIMITVTVDGEVFQSFEVEVTGQGSGSTPEPTPTPEALEAEGCSSGQSAGN
jgi:hypothetical protein